MHTNHFLPKGLPLLSDHVLLKTVAQYRNTYDLLSHHYTEGSRHVRTYIEEALGVLEGELEKRGVAVDKVVRDSTS